MLKSDFNLLHIFRTPFSKDISGRLLLKLPTAIFPRWRTALKYFKNLCDEMHSWKLETIGLSLVKTRAPPLTFCSMIWLTAVPIMGLLSMFWDHLIYFQYYDGLRTLNTMTTFKKFINPLLSKFFVQKQPPELLRKKGFLKNFAKITGKCVHQSLFFNMKNFCQTYWQRQGYHNNVITSYLVFLVALNVAINAIWRKNALQVLVFVTGLT